MVYKNCSLFFLTLSFFNVVDIAALYHYKKAVRVATTQTMQQQLAQRHAQKPDLEPAAFVIEDPHKALPEKVVSFLHKLKWINAKSGKVLKQ